MSAARFALRTTAAALLAVPAAALAQSEERLSADITGTAGYSSNPFSVAGDDTGAAFVSVDVSPRYQLLTERSTLTVSGSANVQQYLRRFSLNDSYLAAVDFATRPSEDLTAHTRLDLSSTILGALNSFVPLPVGAGQIGLGTGAGATGTGAATGTGTGATTVVPPAAFPTPILTDIGLFGLRNRRYLGRVSGDVSAAVTDSDTLTVSTYAEAARYTRLPDAADYEAYGLTLGYSRRISAYFNVGLQASASLFDYDQVGGDTRVFPIEATASGRLSELWTMSGALGVTFIDSSAVGSTTETSLSGNVNACRRGELSNLCIQAARQVSPTGLAGSQYVTTVGVNWSRRIGERENLSLAANYSDVGNDGGRLVIGGVPLRTKFAQAVVGYDRQISQRMRLVASANYRQLLDGGDGRPKDFGGQVGLSYRIGDPR